jgi:class 3 adenylate cyclase/tetratricopeptide (TPR) repeat protein
VPTCGRCATENPPEARFCLACGTPLDRGPEVPQLRRLATVLFCDLVGSTELADRLDAEAVRSVLDRYYATMRAAVERHGGMVEKFIGDAVVGVYGLPQAHEDDALRAVRSAFDMRDAMPQLREALAGYGVELAVRIGIQSGEIVADERAAAVGGAGGDAYNVAARLQGAAAANEVIVGDTAARLLGDAVTLEQLAPLELRGKPVPVSAFRATALPVVKPASARAALVGRARALSTLQRSLDDAREDGACVLVTVLGQPGIGKSRLWTEFTAGLDAGVAVLVGQALPYGDGATFAPVSELVRMACGGYATPPDEIAERLRTLLAGAGDADAVRERLLDLLGLGSGTAAGETSWALRRLIERIAADRPVVVVVDDLHWAEPALLDVLDTLAERTRGAVLMLCLARADLLDLRPTWGGGKARGVTMTLEPLAAEPAFELATSLLAQGTPPAVIERVIAAAEGNPLYLEQLAAMASDGAFTGDADALPIGIHALLAARLDRLAPPEVQALSTAAVQGREFTSTMVGAMTEGASRADTVELLGGLEVRGFVRSLDDSDERWAFAHGLLRDAAERRLTKALRARLHERFADLLDRGGAADDELIGLHLERATRLREELTLRDEVTAALAARAGIHLARAGARAFARIDLPLAANLLGRGAALLPQAAPERLDLLPDLGVALTELGRPQEAAALLADAVAAATESAQEVHALRATVQLLSTRLYLRDIGTDELERAGRAAIAGLEAHGDEAGLAQGWVLIEYLDQARGSYRPALDATLTAMGYARRSGRLREQLQSSGDLPYYLFWGLAGPERVGDAIGQVEAGEDPVSVATGDALHAVAAAWAGDLPGFRSASARHSARLRERGLEWLEATHASTLGMILIQMEHPAEAARLLRASYDTLLRTGDIWWAGVVEPALALSLDLSGRREEFLAVIDQGPMKGVPDDKVTELMWSIVQSRAERRRGRLPEAGAAARELVERCARHDVPMLMAMAQESLADILEEAGRTPEAAEARAVALALYRDRGFRPGIARLEGAR